MQEQGGNKSPPIVPPLACSPSGAPTKRTSNMLIPNATQQTHCMHCTTYYCAAYGVRPPSLQNSFFLSPGLWFGVAYNQHYIPPQGLPSYACDAYSMSMPPMQLALGSVGASPIESRPLNPFREFPMPPCPLRSHSAPPMALLSWVSSAAPVRWLPVARASFSSQASP